jgi:hypothetical protein
LKKTTIILFPLLLSGAAMASEPLSADDVKALFTNKTFDIHNVDKDKKLKGFDSAGGDHLDYISYKDKTSKRKWWLEGNKHCTSHPKLHDNCKNIINIGKGVYHGITKGKHTHILSNFREGNQL